MEIKIRDTERDEVVGVITEDGLETDDELARGTITVSADGAVPMLSAEYDEDSGRLGTAATDVYPSDDGYPRAVAESLPHPFEAEGPAFDTGTGPDGGGSTPDDPDNRDDVESGQDAGSSADGRGEKGADDGRSSNETEEKSDSSGLLPGWMTLGGRNY